MNDAKIIDALAATVLYKDLDIGELEAENQRLREELDRERMVTRDILAHSKNDCDTLKAELDALKEAVRFMICRADLEWFLTGEGARGQRQHESAKTLLRVLDE